MYKFGFWKAGWSGFTNSCPNVYVSHIHHLFTHSLYHRNDKAARWAKAKRPRKSRPSDINKTPVVYEIHSFQKPAEFTISDEPAKAITKGD